MNAIETVQLTKAYGKARGIIDLNLTVREGEFFGFIGPNGAGKSTTIRTLLNLIHPTSGTASVLGRNIGKSCKEILADIGYLPSEAVFYAGMRVKDLLKLSADLYRKDCAGSAAALCERFQLDTSRRIEELSFGNRKKVGIVCALQHHPKLLILDEPTSGLDPLMQREFFTALRELNADGTTVFLSSHILSEIQHNCSRAAIIREGRLIACDRVETLAKTSAKRVTIHGSFQTDGIPGIQDVQRTQEGVNFLYNGNINDLLSLLAQAHLLDLSVTEPDLEEVFMHYYTDGGESR